MDDRCPMDKSIHFLKSISLSWLEVGVVSCLEGSGVTVLSFSFDRGVGLMVDFSRITDFSLILDGV